MDFIFVCDYGHYQISELAMRQSVRTFQDWIANGADDVVDCVV